MRNVWAINVLGLVLAACGFPGQTATLEGQLESGARIEINTETNRAEMVGEGGIRAPLWDGVHTLRDGSTVRVQSGVVIPEMPIVEAPRRPEEARDTPGLTRVPMGLPSQCDRLVEKVCGSRRECSGTEGCDAAQQLLTMEREEKGKATSPVAMTPSGNSCDEALRDEAFFARCTR